MATYHWGSGHYKQYHFSAYHWGGVLAPVPAVVTPTRGGAGLWPYWRLEENPELCKDWVKDNAEKIKKIKKQPVPEDALGAAQKKKEAAGQEAKAREIRRINREINGLKKDLNDTKKSRGEVEKLRDGLEVLKNGLESGSSEQEQLKGTLQWVVELATALGQRVQAIETSLKNQEEKLKAERLEEQKAKTAIAVAPPSPVAQEMAFVQEYKSQLVSRVKAAFPWALGAGVAYLGTRFLVPPKMTWLKLAGYTGTAAFSTIAVFRFLDVDLGMDWLWPRLKAPAEAGPQA